MKNLTKLKQLFPDGKLTSNRWYNINCPFCHEHGFSRDTGYHFGINYIKGYTNCFKCGSKYKLDYFLKIINVSYDKEDFKFDTTNLVIPSKSPVEFPREFINCIDLFDDRYPNYKKALAYIDRRIGIDLAIKLNVGFCSTGRFSNRIIVPIFDSDDNIVYFIARAIYDNMTPKILNPYGEKGAIFYNWHTANKFSEVFLMEGVFGALTVYPYGVASLGKKVSEQQILELLRSNVKIVNIVLDGNAIKDAYELASRISSLSSRVKLRVFELKGDTQPDDFNFDFFMQMKRHVPFYNCRSVFYDTR